MNVGRFVSYTRVVSALVICRPAEKDEHVPVEMKPFQLMGYVIGDEIMIGNAIV